MSLLAKKKLNKEGRIKITAYCLFFLCIFFLNLFISATYGDDPAYTQILKNETLLSFSINHYKTWSARTLVEAVLVLVAYCNIFVFRILNALCITLLVACIQKIFSFKFTLANFVVCAALVFCYTWYDLQSAGYVTTFMVMFWPFVLCIFVITTYQNSLQGIKNSTGKYIATSLALLYATNLELMVPYMLIILGVYTVLLCKKYKKIHASYFVNIVILLFNMVYALTAPGTAARSDMMVAGYFIDYDMIPFIAKIQRGVYDALANKFTTLNLAFVFLAFIICTAIFKQYKNILFRVFSVCYLALVLFLNLAPFSNRLNQTVQKFFAISKAINVSNQNSLLTYIPFMLLCFLLLFTLVGIYLALGHTQKTFITITIFIAGFLSAASLGLTPALAVSGARTYVAFAFSIIMAGYAIFTNLLPTLTKKQKICIYSVIAILAMVQMYILAESYWAPIY